MNLDLHVIMPNHLHAIVDVFDRDAWRTEAPTLRAGSLGAIVGGFKAGVTSRARSEGLLGPGERLWQRSFHDAALRTERNVADAREYVRRNPELWRQDPDR